ncbi:MAG: metallopeptidase TldD-related protein [Eubacteriales bacterium]|nr:metallopeptidase TldD-related protein [Eubacteriales bacterium]
MRDLKLIADNILSYIKEQGAEQAACKLKQSVTSEISYLNGKFSLLRTLEDEIANLEIIQDKRYASLGGNRLDDAELKTLADDCFKGLASADPDEARRFVPAGEAVQKEKTSGVLEADREAMFRLLQEFIEDVAKNYPTLLISELYLEHDYEESYKAFSSGANFHEINGSYQVVLNCSSVVGEKSSSFFYNGLMTEDIATPLIEREPFKSDLKMIAEQYKAEPLEKGFAGSVVMTPACLDDMLYYLAANFTGDLALLTESSPWRDRLGEQVVDSRLNLRVAPLDERFVGGSLATSEGFAAENYDLFRQGKLQCFSLSDYVARKTGRERAKNSEQYSYYVLEAEETEPLEDLIKGIDRGIYMMRFSGGEPAGNGDFAGVIKNSFLIENGKLTRPLREVMLSSNLEKLFLNIGGYSSEHINDGFKDLPWVRFDNVGISSK